MMITGSLNTITTKAADNFTTQDRYGNAVTFNHPFVQAACMFVGEMSNVRGGRAGAACAAPD